MNHEVHDNRRTWLLAAGVFLLALATFLPAVGNDFVSLDDSLYVYDNLLVKGGLTVAGVARAFAGPECNFYHPLTMLSLMLDHQLWGLNPAGYHATNVLLHALSAALLFGALWQFTGARWRSAFVAALWAVHPLRVESVAWIAERKDVLSALFFMLTLVGYAFYVRRPGVGRYGALLGVFILGLLAKTSLVTLPAILLLLDYWPLGRFDPVADNRVARGLRMLGEKVPLFVLAMIAIIVSGFAQKAGVLAYDDFPLMSRLQNAVLSGVVYLSQLFMPIGLSPFYPFRSEALTPGAVVASLALLLGLTAWAIAWWRRVPYFFVGWFWYLGVLVPMLGIIQIGTYAHADRFTYLPQIGLLLAGTWAGGDLAERFRLRPAIRNGLAAILVVAAAGMSIRQIGTWADSEKLFRHALSVTRDNALAHSSLGTALLEPREKGALVARSLSPAVRAEALAHFQEAVRLEPDRADLQLNLGLTLAAAGARDEAVPHLRRALQTMNFHAIGHRTLGILLLEQGALDEAKEHLEAAVRLSPADRLARNNLGAIYRRQGRISDAILQYRAALESAPDYADAHNNLGIALFVSGDKGGAIREFQEALRCDPENAQARQNLRAVTP